MPCSGQRLNASELRELLRAATLRLEQRAAAIDRLNVFPVPDADTGSNMAHGMRRGLLEAEQERSAAADAVAAAFARGALAGARGNSGLILSQFWRGLAEAARGSPTLGVEDLARGLAAGSDLAYRAVARPVPGTILTVMQDVARAAEKPDGSLAAFLRRLVEAARESVKRTPRLLAVLRRSGVVDAGAEGLHRVLEGAWRFVQARAGEPLAEEPDEAPPEPGYAAHPASRMQPQEAAYGFCTEFFLHARAPDPDRVRAALQELGSSLIVTESEGAVRVHIHTGSPQVVLERAGELGRLEQVSTRDMDAQHREARLGPGGVGGQAVIARVPGAGLASVFRSLGAAEAAVRGDPAEEARLLAALPGCPGGGPSPDPQPPRRRGGGRAPAGAHHETAARRGRAHGAPGGGGHGGLRSAGRAGGEPAPDAGGHRRRALPRGPGGGRPRGRPAGRPAGGGRNGAG